MKEGKQGPLFTPEEKSVLLKVFSLAKREAGSLYERQNIKGRISSGTVVREPRARKKEKVRTGKRDRLGKRGQ